MTEGAPPEVSVSADQVAWLRMQKSGLVSPFSSAVDAARQLIGIQAQVLRSAGLQLSARLDGFDKSDLEEQLYERRSLVKLWGQRRTLHLYEPNDWPRLHALFRNRRTWADMALKKVGGDVDALLAAVDEVATRIQDREGVTKKTLLAEQPELAPFLNLGIGLFMDIVQRGAACHAEPVGSQSQFVARARWLPDLQWTQLSRDEAGRAWTERYLAAYGPATPHDLAFWLGDRVSDARAWISSLGERVVAADVGGVPHFMLAPDAELLLDRDTETPPRAEWPVRLLHRYDVFVLAHKDKSWIVDDRHYKTVWRKAGVVDAVVLVKGRIAGVWGYDLKTRSVRVTVEPFRRMSAATKRSVAREARRVAAHLEVELSGVTYV